MWGENKVACPLFQPLFPSYVILRSPSLRSRVNSATKDLAARPFVPKATGQMFRSAHMTKRGIDKGSCPLFTYRKWHWEPLKK